jgi:hypothetical protein
MDALVLSFFALIPLGIIYSRYKIKIRRYDMLVKMAELGREIDPEILDNLGDKQKTYKDDYRSALIWVACGIPILI